MRRAILTAVVIIMAALLPVTVHAQTATVTGHVIFPSGVASTNAKVCFSLQNFKPNLPRIASTGTLVQQQNWCVQPAADGSFSVQIVRNDLLAPVGTFWRIDWLWNGQQQSSATYIVNHTPFNLDTETPLSQSVPAGPNQISVQCYPFLQITPASTWVITHNENDQNVFVQTSDLTGGVVFPDHVDISNPNVTTITWFVPQSGRALVCHGGSINIATNQPNAVITNAVAPQIVNNQPVTLQGNLAVQGTLSSSTMNGVFIVDGVTYPTLQAAITAAPTTGGKIFLPTSNYNFSSTIALDSTKQNLTIECSGVGWKNNGSTRGPTTLTWTGGASPMFTATSVNGFTMNGCSANNTGSATDFFRISVGHDIKFSEISISSPTVAFTNSGISCIDGGNASVRVTIDKSYMVDGAPIMVDCDRVNGLSIIGGTVIRGSAGGVRVGNTIQSNWVSFTDFDCEQSSGGGASTACVDVKRAEGVSWKGGYCEGNLAGQLCLRLPNALVDGADVSGIAFKGLGVAAYAIETNGALGVSIHGNSFNNFTTGGVHFLANVSDTTLFSNSNVSGTPNVGVIFAGSATFANTAIGSGACSAIVTVAFPGISTGMSISNPTYTTAPTITDEQLIVNVWLTAGNVNFNRCNPTAGSLTPTVMIANWKAN